MLLLKEEVGRMDTMMTAVLGEAALIAGIEKGRLHDLFALAGVNGLAQKLAQLLQEAGHIMTEKQTVTVGPQSLIEALTDSGFTICQQKLKDSELLYVNETAEQAVKTFKFSAFTSPSGFLDSIGNVGLTLCNPVIAARFAGGMSDEFLKTQLVAPFMVEDKLYSLNFIFNGARFASITNPVGWHKDHVFIVGV